MSGYVDLQVNGFAGIDFNSNELDLESIRTGCRRLADDGCTRFLPTVITAPIEKMQQRIAAIASAIQSDSFVKSIVAGIHVEGPFINPADGFVGAHPVDAVLPADVQTAERLVDAGAGYVKLFTLAPECDTKQRTTRWLSDQGIRVAAGHSDATREELRASVDEGLALFTHLGNGCPAQVHRHDNIIQRVLSLADRLYVSFIADGHHIPMFALANYVQSVAPERIIVVSDAISAAGLGPGQHRLSDQMVEVDHNGAAWSADRKHFAGSATPVSRMKERLRDSLRIDEGTLVRWTVENPLRFLGDPG